MSGWAAAANLAWVASCGPSWARFTSALGCPERTQHRLLRRQLAASQTCQYGRACQFGAIAGYEEFQRRVPLTGYDDMAPWIEKIRHGEPAVLTSAPVTRLMPTSGSTGARKLIPFTASLQREFNAAIGPWIVDLARQHSDILGGAAYWSVTPAAQFASDEASAVPIGFEDDADYVGGARRHLIDAAMAVPSLVREVDNVDLFRRIVLLLLLRRADLRLISVWHPSFLSLLLDAMPAMWDDLLRDIETGGGAVAMKVAPRVRAYLSSLRPLRHRADQLRQAGPARIDAIWPKLRVVSCWGDGHARFACTDLARRLPGATFQPKGLLATEAFVTIPFAGEYPVAITSHFFEFIDERGAVHRVHELRAGAAYEVVVTTGGGLWRYRTGDQVEVTGFVRRTPSLRFVGRSGSVSDLCGEKLSEAFVAHALRTACVVNGSEAARFAMLAPEEKSPGRWHYVLFVEGDVDPGMRERLEAALRKNPHYAYCRDLGQLQPLHVSSLAGGAYERFATAEMARGARLGDIKPVALSRRSDWSQQFATR